MANLKVRMVLGFLTLAAFFGPFMAVVAIENAKRDSKATREQELAIAAKKEADDARYQYYLSVTQQRDNLKQSMTDAKAQYEQLLKDQPALVQNKKKTVTQTTLEPVTSKKVVSQPSTTTTTKAATVSTPAAATTPKAVATPKPAAPKPAAATKAS